MCADSQERVLRLIRANSWLPPSGSRAAGGRGADRTARQATWLYRTICHSSAPNQATGGYRQQPLRIGADGVYPVVVPPWTLSAACAGQTIASPLDTWTGLAGTEEEKKSGQPG